MIEDISASNRNLKRIYRILQKSQFLIVSNVTFRNNQVPRLLWLRLVNWIIVGNSENENLYINIIYIVNIYITCVHSLNVH